MKYTPEQKDKSVRKKQCLRWENEQMRRRLKKEFPIEVYFDGEFYIVESKINYDVCT